MRVLQYGVGAMGSLMVQLLSSRRDVSIVGAIDIDPDKVDRDLGDVANVGQRLGIIVKEPGALRKLAADVALHATTAFAENAYPIISSLIAQGIKCDHYHSGAVLSASKEFGNCVRPRSTGQTLWR